MILNGKAFETNYLIDFDSNFSWAWPFTEIQWMEEINSNDR